MPPYKRKLICLMDNGAFIPSFVWLKHLIMCFFQNYCSLISDISKRCELLVSCESRSETWLDIRGRWLGCVRTYYTDPFSEEWQVNGYIDVNGEKRQPWQMSHTLWQQDYAQSIKFIRRRGNWDPITAQHRFIDWQSYGLPLSYCIFDGGNREVKCPPWMCLRGRLHCCSIPLVCFSAYTPARTQQQLRLPFYCINRIDQYWIC